MACDGHEPGGQWASSQRVEGGYRRARVARRVTYCQPASERGSLKGGTRHSVGLPCGLNSRGLPLYYVRLRANSASENLDYLSRNDSRECATLNPPASLSARLT